MSERMVHLALVESELNLEHNSRRTPPLERIFMYKSKLTDPLTKPALEHLLCASPS